MAHRFPLKEIAQQAGLSLATVDRAVHARAHVSARTKARVAAAIEELAGQAAQLVAKGRRMFVDVVIEAPERFSREVRQATQAALPELAPFVIRPRFACHEVMTAAQTVAILDRIARRGSQGVCLKARDVPAVHAAVARLAAKGIPVVSLVTDLAGSDRIAYVGLDNLRAGQVAGRLIGQLVQSGVVIATQSQDGFAGEDARLRGFAQAMAQHAPAVEVLTIKGSGGLNPATGQAVTQALSTVGGVQGVYSAGGANRAITGALAQMGQVPQVYVAHDLDADNRALLAEGALTYVLHHDLTRDMVQAFRHMMHFHRLTGPVGHTAAQVQIIVPENMPG